MTAAENLPPVSVILPVYNSGRFLHAAIESVLAQTLLEFELIIVDGGSTDGTGEIARGFGGRVRHFGTGRDNVSIAKNFGLNHAQHDIIAFMSGDDLWLPDKLEKQVRSIATHQGAAISICRIRYFLHEGHEWPASFPERLRTGEHTARICETLVCNRDAFERIGPFEETLQTAEDVDWFARAQHLEVPIEEIPEVLVHKGVHDQNTSIVSSSARADLMRALGGSIRRKKTTP